MTCTLDHEGNRDLPRISDFLTSQKIKEDHRDLSNSCVCDERHQAMMYQTHAVLEARDVNVPFGFDDLLQTRPDVLRGQGREPKHGATRL